MTTLRPVCGSSLPSLWARSDQSDAGETLINSSQTGRGGRPVKGVIGSPDGLYPDPGGP